MTALLEDFNLQDCTFTKTKQKESIFFNKHGKKVYEGVFYCQELCNEYHPFPNASFHPLKCYSKATKLGRNWVLQYKIHLVWHGMCKFQFSWRPWTIQHLNFHFTEELHLTFWFGEHILKICIHFTLILVEIQKVQFLQVW